jgi:hypothetical protein
MTVTELLTAHPVASVTETVYTVLWVGLATGWATKALLNPAEGDH